MNNKTAHPLIRSTARFNRLALIVSLLWTSALGSVVLISLASGGPAGNNGTIKVDNAPFDDAPNNEPHVACTFQIDFYGYDKGDLWADVVFEQQPPTTGGSMTVTGKTHVFIGADDNSGGGSVAGLDASENYKLAFSGVTPQPQQGYHVKLTIHADGSQGADVKHKTFWVEPCSVPTTPTPKPSAAPSPSPTATPKHTPQPTPTPAVSGSITPTPSPTPNGSPSPTPTVSVEGTTTPTPGVGGSTPTPRPGSGGTTPTPVPTAIPLVAGITGNWSAPVTVGAVRLPNTGSALVLLTLLLAAVPTNLVLIIWSIRRQLADRRMLEQLIAETDTPAEPRA